MIKKNHEYTKQQRDFIKNNVKGIKNKKLAELFNIEFKTNVTESMMNSYKGNHKLTSDLDTRFKVGIIPHNKGKKCLNMHPNAIATQFKKGNIPVNHKPIGTEIIDKKDGYIKIKIGEPNKWKYKHRMIWEQYHGKIPKANRHRNN